MRKQTLIAMWIVIAMVIGSLQVSMAAEPNIVPNDPLVTWFEQTDVSWALKSQRDMAMDERISNVMNLGTHNSFNASAEGYNRELLYQPNQLFTITDQLRIGVRLIELDVYDGGNRLFVSHTDSPIVYKIDFPVFLNVIKVWLDNNVNEVIFLDIEDGASGSPLLLAWICTFFGGGYDLSTGKCQDLSNGMMFTPVDREGDPFYGRWPTRNELLALGKRVILFNHKDLSDGNYRLFTAYSAEDDKIYLWRGSDYFFSTGSNNDISQAFSDSTINDFWDGKDLPVSYQQDISRFFAVRSDGLGGGPRAMVGADVAYCAMNNVNFIKMDFVFGQEYDIDDFGGTSHNDYDAPGGWGSIADGMEPDNLLDNIRGNRLSRAIWSWQIDTILNSNIYLSQQRLHSPSAKVPNRTDDRHYVVQERFTFDPDRLPHLSILSPDPLVPVVTRGHWNTQEKENVHPFACTRLGSNRTEWQITQQKGSWDEGQQICDQEFNNKGDGTWAFAGPVNGYQNLWLLTFRWLEAKNNNRIQVLEQPVWINVSDKDNDAVWTVRETGENFLPIANAGQGQSVSAGPDGIATIALDGSGSSDPDGDPLTYTWTWDGNIATGVSPTILLPVGTTVITLVVNDGFEDSQPDYVTITVTDDTPPGMNLSVSPQVLWPPNHKMVPVTITVSVSDNSDSSPSCMIRSVVSNEPVNGSGDGNTSPDWDITGDLTVDLRSERSGNGNGRVYTIGVECTDASDNSSIDTVRVYVPHDQGDRPDLVDDDGDGYSEYQGDCNDNDTTIYPGAEEFCADGIDQNCNGRDLPCGVDPDEDGIANDQDSCPDSDLSETVVIDGCDSGVSNTVLSNGCTISDEIVKCEADSRNHGQYVSCVSHLTNDLKHDGVLTGREKGAIQNCVASDGDIDGVPDPVEQGPQGNDPNYDGNKDGISDFLQGHVASCYTHDQKHYVTMACYEPMSDAAAVGKPSAAGSPSGVKFPYGFFEFTINIFSPGDTTRMTLYLPVDAKPNTYYKYGPTPDDHTYHWYEFMYDDQTLTGAELSGNVVTLHFVDGQRGDDDLTANGTIVDQGGPGITSTSTTPTSSGGGCFIDTVNLFE